MSLSLKLKKKKEKCIVDVHAYEHFHQHLIHKCCLSTKTSFGQRLSKTPELNPSRNAKKKTQNPDTETRVARTNPLAAKKNLQRIRRHVSSNDYRVATEVPIARVMPGVGLHADIAHDKTCAL
jgi:hypothetical protein